MIELQDIFLRHGTRYKENHKLPFHIHKTISNIQSCRTAKIGGHIDQCDNTECGHINISYNSCRDRHCPKCQTIAKERWLENRKMDLLDIGYFHIVFTIPQELNYPALLNQKEVYNIL